MSKHTPGPWKVEPYTDGGPYHVMTAEGYAIADMAVEYSSIEDIDEHAANARLISRAPTMLALLERVRDELEASGGFDGDESLFSAVVEEIKAAAGE